jgi:hypothetical protein
MHSCAARCCLRSDTLQRRDPAPHIGRRTPVQPATLRNRRMNRSIRFLLRPAGSNKTLRQRAATMYHRHAKLGMTASRAASTGLPVHRVLQKNPIPNKLRLRSLTRSNRKSMQPLCRKDRAPATKRTVWRPGGGRHRLCPPPQPVRCEMDCHPPIHWPGL